MTGTATTSTAMQPSAALSPAAAIAELYKVAIRRTQILYGGMRTGPRQIIKLSILAKVTRKAWVHVNYSPLVLSTN